MLEFPHAIHKGIVWGVTTHVQSSTQTHIRQNEQFMLADIQRLFSLIFENDVWE